MPRQRSLRVGSSAARGVPTRRGAATGIAVVAALGIGAALLLPSLGGPGPTPTTPPGETTSPPPPDAPTPAPASRSASAILGAGWGELDAGPVAGRIGPTAAWTGSRLFVWGGYEPGPFTPVPGHTWRHDGALYDPASGLWSPVAPLPDIVCPPRGPAVALAAGDMVILRLRTHWRADCATAAAYYPAADSWEPLRAEFFRRATWVKPIAWTGELFVSPRDGIAYDWATGETLPIPQMPSGWEDGAKVDEVHWAGDRVIVVGSSGVLEWEPSAEAWRRIGPPASVSPGSASAWTDAGLVVVDYRLGAAIGDGAVWDAHDGFPIVLHLCPLSVVSVGGTPVVRACSGLSAWDDVRSTWVPMPLDDVTAWDPFGTTVVGGDDAVYAIGLSMRRLPIERAADGSIVAPATVPVGTLQLDLPAGFEFASSFGLVEGTVDRLILPRRSVPEVQAIGLRLEAEGDVRCTVTAAIVAAGVMTDSRDGLAVVGPVSVPREGRPPLAGTALRDDDGGLAFAFAGIDTRTLLRRFDDAAEQEVVVRCAGPADTLFGAATAVAAGLWSPAE